MSVLVLSLLTGLVFSAALGNAFELQAGSPARLSEPFVSPDNIAASLLRVTLAGPYLMVGEMIAVRGNHNLALLPVMLVIAFASLWAIAYGVIWLELLFRISQSF